MKNQIWLITLVTGILLSQTTTTIPYSQLRPPLNIPDSAIFLTKATDAAGGNKFCLAGNGPNFQCKIGDALYLTTLVQGVVVTFVPTINCASNCLLDLNGLGPKAIYLKDGLSQPTLVANEPYILYFDGAAWRVIA